MSKINFIDDFIRSKTDVYYFVRENFRGDIFLELYNERFNSIGSECFDEVVCVCAELYDYLFKLNMRLNIYSEIYDDVLIDLIVREAVERFGDKEGKNEFSEQKLRSAVCKRVTSFAQSEAFAVDCHVHTSDGSGCAHSGIRDMVERAIKIGLNGIFITEHDIFTPPDIIDNLNEIYAPFKIFSGIEIRIDGDDFLVLGIHDDVLQQRSWEYAELYRFVREKEGFLALAHPLRYWNGINANILSFKPDALELYSNNIKKYENSVKQNVLSLANSLGTNVIANSDAHSVNDFCYCNEFFRTPVDEADLIGMLKNGEYRLVNKSFENKVCCDLEGKE